MQLITESTVLEEAFNTSMNNYYAFYWASAWAGIDLAPFNKLHLMRKKIHQVTIGIHFYQTHPDFIATFQEDNRVRYIMQPSGTFHPKLYLFENNDEDWTLITGSANFTASAFAKNSEASILVSSKDSGVDQIYRDAKKYINTSWRMADQFTDDEVNRYRERWKLNRMRIKELAGEYGGNARGHEAPHQTPIMNWTWDQYVLEIHRLEAHTVAERLDLLQRVKQYLASVPHFMDIELEKRKYIAGIHNSIDPTSWKFFGSMVGNGVYKNRIIEGNNHISDALDLIPYSSNITQSQYEDYVSLFQQGMHDHRFADSMNLGTATRLLAMKRPDTFVCYDSANKRGLCRDFRLKQSKIDFESYWEDIICRIRDCVWYNSPVPRSSEQRRIWNARAAFLDSLYYGNE